MMNDQLDWPTWLASINLLQVAIVILALWVVVRLLVKFFPWLKKALKLIDALGQLPAFIDRTDARIAEIHHEVNYNNGSSVKDAVSRVEIGVKGLYERVDELTDSDTAIRKELENTKPPKAIKE